jgi:hypothetical protein
MKKIIYLLLLSFSTLYGQSFVELKNHNLPGISDGNSVWFDFDNDGDLDLLLSGHSSAGIISKIFRNNGDKTFTETSIALPDFFYGTVTCADYDRDGWIDIIFRNTIYRNNGDSTFSLYVNIPLVNTSINSYSWCDYDNDGDLDFLFTGVESNNNIVKVYRNNGNNTFSEQTNLKLKAVVNGKISLADINNDSYPDIILTGSESKIYLNDKNGNFIENGSFKHTNFSMSSTLLADYDNDNDLDILTFGSGNPILYRNSNNIFTAQSQLNFPYVSKTSAAWGDYNKDGYLDLLLSGSTTRLYKNNKNASFTAQTGVSLGLFDNSIATWCDFDNDGDLDIFITGDHNGSSISEIFENRLDTINSLPPTPTNLHSLVTRDSVVLSWKAIPDSVFHGNYTVKIGKANEGNEVLSSESLNNGKRQIISLGKIETDSFYIYKNVSKGKFYWNVQAIDNSFIGSHFSYTDSFSYTINRQAKNIKLSRIGARWANLKWTRGGGEKCAVFVKKDSAGRAIPLDNNSYTANASFGLGSQIDSTNWFCVYNGIADSVFISNLDIQSNYIFQVVEYEGGSGSEHYYSENETNNPIAAKTDFFEELTSVKIKGVGYGSAEWGDYDNDGYLDFLITGTSTGGMPLTRIYRNNGNSGFIEQSSIGLANVDWSSAAWGDYDNDGDLDILLTGYGTGSFSKIYRNNGNNSFTSLDGIALTQLDLSSVAWGDYDNDGDLDILQSGYAGSKAIADLYRNNGNGQFSKVLDSIFIGLTRGSVAWGDYDNDGYLDILQTGGDPKTSRAVSKIYHNNGNNGFTAIDSTLDNVAMSSAVWGDYDNDGDLDILITGSDNSLPLGQEGVSKVYMNEGNNKFKEQTSISLVGLTTSSAAWGDYDNDGDLDILITGGSSSKGYFAKIYRNDGGNTFTEQSNILIPGVIEGSVAWGDYDNDGDLDILFSGYNSKEFITKIFRNESSVKNQAPNAPTNLQIIKGVNSATFTWDKSTDYETPQNGLSYNLYVYDLTRKSYLRAPNAVNPLVSNNGKRLLAQSGSIQYSDNGYVIKNIPSGRYIWGVQSVDAGFAGSPFATADTFSMVNLEMVDVDIKNGKLTNTDSAIEFSLNSTDGSNGDWIPCGVGFTNVDYNPLGGFEVWVRERALISNIRKVVTVSPQVSPNFTVDYSRERTSEFLSDSVEYAYNSDMINAFPGGFFKLPLIPGQNVYFRIKATAQKVASTIQELFVPKRPETPQFTIDYENETTNEIVSSDFEYASNVGMLNPVGGKNTQTDLTPGNNLYFRKKATLNSFKSLVESLIVDPRPSAPLNPIVDDINDTLNWTNNPLFPEVSSYEFSLDGGATWNDCPSKPIYIGNIYVPAGSIRLRVGSSVTNFRSDVLTLAEGYTQNPILGMESVKFSDIIFYPNPIKDFLYIETGNSNVEIEVFNLLGLRLKSIKKVNKSQSLYLGDLAAGIYILRVKTNNNIKENRIIKE